MAGATTDWIHFPCAGTPEARWRYLGDGSIELEGQGVVVGSWNKNLDQWHDHITFFSAKYGVPAYNIAGIMDLESGGNAQACSPCSACPGIANCSICCAFGLMQITLGTAQGLAKEMGLPVPSASDLRNDPELNLELGTKYFSDLLKRYNGDYVSAAVGYNAGSVRCGGCKSGTFWNICTDGSAYPLIAIKNANAALANGFPLGELPPISQPPLPMSQKFKPSISNFGVAMAAAAGSFIAFQLTRDYFTPRRLRSLFG
jgi:Transglycosylase SLT domain